MLLLELFFRIMGIAVSGFISSLPMFAVTFFDLPISATGMLAISFSLFVIFSCFESYRFSFAYWKWYDYFIGQFLPFIIYMLIGAGALHIVSPYIFNRIFLPLRFAQCLGFSSEKYIFVSTFIALVFVTVLRIIGAYQGKKLYEEIENEQALLWAEKIAETEVSAKEAN